MHHASAYIDLCNSGLIATVESGSIGRISFDELSTMLNHYFALSKARFEKMNNDSTFSVLTAKADNEQLISHSLFYNKIYVEDPIIAHCNLKFHSRFQLGQKFSLDEFKELLIREISFFQFFKPLIETGIVNPIPVTQLPDEVPILASKDQFAEFIPTHLKKYIYDSAKVYKAITLEDGQMIVPFNNEELKPCRAILVRIDDAEMIYKLIQFEPKDFNDDGTITIAAPLVDNSIPDENSFWPWVKQSINQVAKNKLYDLSKNLCVASKMNSSYSTLSDFEKNILRLTYSDKTKSSPVNFLDVNISDIRMWRPTDIAKLREKHQKAFERFQFSLLDIASELKNLSPEEFKEKSQIHLKKDIYPQVDEIRNIFSPAFVAGTLAGMGSVAISIGLAISTGASLSVASAIPFVCAGGAVGSLSAIPDHIRKQKRPEFIWSKILK